MLPTELTNPRNLFETRKGKGHAAATAELDSLRGVNGVTAALASDATVSTQPQPLTDFGAR